MTAALTLEQLCVRAGSFCLGPLDLTLAAGDYLVVMGATGAGKSLLIKAICGLLRPSSGRVWVDGREVTGLPPRERRVGYVPQSAALFPHLSVARNITFGAWAAGRDEAAALAQSAPVLAVLGLEPLLERRPATLSGGERQKVALARALCTTPRLLVLDEPVSALDEPSRRSVCAALRDLHVRIGMTTLHVCHSLEEARAVAHRLGIIAAGQWAWCGAMAAIDSAPPAHPAARRLLGLD